MVLYGGLLGCQESLNDKFRGRPFDVKNKGHRPKLPLSGLRARGLSGAQKLLKSDQPCGGISKAYLKAERGSIAGPKVFGAPNAILLTLPLTLWPLWIVCSKHDHDVIRI